MNNAEAKHFIERLPTDAHKSYIRNSILASDPLSTLIEVVFQHQPAQYWSKDILSQEHPSTLKTEGPSCVYIASEFYVNHFAPVQIHKGISTTNATLTAEEFVEQVVLKTSSYSRNNLSFLVGDIGCGKTAFINQLISLYGRDWVNSGKTWFIRLDIDIVGRQESITESDILFLLIQKIQYIIHHNDDLRDLREHCNKIKKLESAEGSSIQELQEILYKYARIARQQCGRHLFLILDNWDYIYHLRERDLFQQKSTANSDAITIVNQLILHFFHDSGSVLGRLGANILFVLREESYSLLTEKKKLMPNEYGFDYHANAYTIATADWETVVKKRSDLLMRLVDIPFYNPKDKMRLQKIFDHVYNDLSRRPSGAGSHTPSLSEHVNRLAVFGLRDVVRFYAQYTWIGGSDQEYEFDIDRILPTAAGLLAFILDGHKRFSQQLCHFPNIYLVNSQSFSHSHTYWLKRLIFEYVFQTKEQTGDRIRPAHVAEIFEEGDGYDSQLVRECMGSLIQSHQSHLLRCNRRVNVEHNDLEPWDLYVSSRGIHSAKYMFDRFYYLQLIVEDDMLPIPKIVADAFRFKKHGLDYGYLVFPAGEYGMAARAMIISKMSQVFIFLQILKASLEVEKYRYPEVFKRLRDENIVIPDPDLIIKGITGELNSLSHVFERLESSGAYENSLALYDDLYSFFLHLVVD